MLSSLYVARNDEKLMNLELTSDIIMKCYVRDSLANMIKRDVTESTTASDVDANVIIIIIIIIIVR